MNLIPYAVKNRRFVVFGILFFLGLGGGNFIQAADRDTAGELVRSAGFLLEAKGYLEESRVFISMHKREEATESMKGAYKALWKARQIACVLGCSVKPPKGMEKFPADMPLKIRCALENPNFLWFSSPGDRVVCAMVRITTRVIEDYLEQKERNRRNDLKNPRIRAGLISKYLGKVSLAYFLLERAFESLFSFQMNVEESFGQKRESGPFIKGWVKPKPLIFGGKPEMLRTGDLRVYKYIDRKPAIRGRSRYWVIGVGPYYRKGVPFLIPPLECYELKVIAPPINPKKAVSKAGDPRLNHLKTKLDGVLGKLRSALSQKEENVLSKRVASCLKGISGCLALGKSMIGEKKWASSTAWFQDGMPCKIKGFCLRNPFFRNGTVKCVLSRVGASERLRVFWGGPTGKGVYLWKGKIKKVVSGGGNEGNGKVGKWNSLKKNSTIKMISVFKTSKMKPGRDAWFVLSPPVKLPIKLDQVPDGGERVHFVLEYQSVLQE